MSFHPIVFAILLYASIVATFAFLRGCEREIYALRCQSEEIRLGVARLKAALKL